jgi:uncharacterized membrane protein YagU involved in acid resistance
MTNDQISDRPTSLFMAILLTGLLAGTLDITAAIIQFCIPTPRNPVRIFEFIASGVFGTSAFSTGPVMAFLGLVFHYFIAIAWTSVFFTLYPRIPWLAHNKVLGGLLYGIIVWLMMNLVILPLSNVPHFPIRFPQALIGVAILMIAIGLPISLRASKYYSNR